jgi:hypothetical protein
MMLGMKLKSSTERIMLSILTTVRSLNKNILFFKKVDKVKIFEKM